MAHLCTASPVPRRAHVRQLFLIWQVKQLCEVLLGVSLPEPELNPAAFSTAVTHALAEAPAVFDPIRSVMGPWIKTSRLHGQSPLSAMMGSACEGACLVS